MPSLKEVRTRIASVKSTQQITSAMKMVAASKLRKAQTGILQLRPFAQKQKQMLQELSSGNDTLDSGSYAVQRTGKKLLIVVFSSNRGLCGAFNTNVIKQVNNTISNWGKPDKPSDLGLITIGRKASEYFKRQGFNVIESHDDLYDNLNFNNASVIAEKLMKMFKEGHFDKIMFVYHQFRNAVVQRLITEQFLPVEPALNDSEESHVVSEFIYDPSKEEILEELIPQILKTQFYKALLDSWASELGARMTAMSQATDNAAELLKDLRLSYNKARQAAITKEILEIVSGAEALKNS
ncbi:MAG: ATP synthase F1 subunit gamma [Lentimicrobium sp.]|nr:ATP synthase F1 subunit gamma [Lentimicrobium sp.]HPG32224.1 ATP synthase F1 subunit gamma [Lentimicrobium sp.]